MRKMLILAAAALCLGAASAEAFISGGLGRAAGDAVRSSGRDNGQDAKPRNMPREMTKKERDRVLRDFGIDPKDPHAQRKWESIPRKKRKGYDHMWRDPRFGGIDRSGGRNTNSGRPEPGSFDDRRGTGNVE